MLGVKLAFIAVPGGARTACLHDERLVMAGAPTLANTRGFEFVRLPPSLESKAWSLPRLWQGS